MNIDTLYMQLFVYQQEKDWEAAVEVQRIIDYIEQKEFTKGVKVRNNDDYTKRTKERAKPAI